MMLRSLLALAAVSCVFGSDGGSEHVEPAGSKVVVLDADSFDAAVTQYTEGDAQLLMVEFYAPWCAHCQALFPEYTATSLRLQDTDGLSGNTLAKMDMTPERNADIGERYGVSSFPTLLVFASAVDEPTSYEGPRNADAIVKFLQDLAAGETPGLLVREPEGSRVLELRDAAAFDTIVQDKMIPLLLLQWYAPWCGFCQKLAPHFRSAASRLHEAGVEVVFAKLDATAEAMAEVVEAQGIKSFPWMQIYRHGHGPETYRGGRTVVAITRYMTAIANGRKHPLASYEGTPPAAAMAAAAASLPRLVSTAHFESQCLGDSPCLVELFEESCASCLTVLPAMGMAHLWLDPQTLPIAAIDVHHHYQVAQRLGITRLPAILAFHDGEMARFPSGAAYTADNLISFYECVVYPDEECVVEITREAVPPASHSVFDSLSPFSSSVAVLGIAALAVILLSATKSGGQAAPAQPRAAKAKKQE